MKSQSLLFLLSAVLCLSVATALPVEGTFELTSFYYDDDPSGHSLNAAWTGAPNGTDHFVVTYYRFVPGPPHDTWQPIGDSFNLASNQTSDTFDLPGSAQDQSKYRIEIQARDSSNQLLASDVMACPGP